MKRNAGFILFVLACLAAAAMPLALPGGRGLAPASGFPGWPATFEGLPIRPAELTPAEEAFSRAFPGRMRRFTDGSRSFVMRWVVAPTHRVHSGIDCLRAAGGRLTPRDLWRDADGRLWAAWELADTGGTVRVRERCYDGRGESWPDVSSWYWAATLGKTDGPWWIVTVAERAD